MILVDPIRTWPRRRGLRHTDWCHMVSDASLEELHAFAIRLGLKPGWFQNKRVPHYDITTRTRQRAVALGAREVTGRELVMRAIRRAA